MKEHGREVLVNVGVGAQDQGGKGSVLFAKLELVTDLREGQAPAAHLRQEYRFEGKVDLGELHNIRLELHEVARQLDPGGDEADGALSAPNRPADLMPAPLPAIRLEVLGYLRVEQTPQLEQVVDVKIMRQMCQLIVFTS